MQGIGYQYLFKIDSRTKIHESKIKTDVDGSKQVIVVSKTGIF